VSERAGELLDAFQAAWTARNAWAFTEICAPDLHYEDPFLNEPLESPRALGTHAERLWAGFPDVRVERSGERLTDGRWVSAPVRVVGTNSGELDGLPPTKRFVVVHAVLYCELDAERERLWRVRVFCDRYEAAVQLGLLPKPGSMGEKALLALRGFGLSPRR
jgi:predicted ester cyclase